DDTDLGARQERQRDVVENDLVAVRLPDIAQRENVFSHDQTTWQRIGVFVLVLACRAALRPGAGPASYPAACVSDEANRHRHLARHVVLLRRREDVPGPAGSSGLLRAPVVFVGGSFVAAGWTGSTPACTGLACPADRTVHPAAEEGGGVLPARRRSGSGRLLAGVGRRGGEAGAGVRLLLDRARGQRACRPDRNTDASYVGCHVRERRARAEHDRALHAV